MRTTMAPKSNVPRGDLSCDARVSHDTIRHSENLCQLPIRHRSEPSLFVKIDSKSRRSYAHQRPGTLNYSDANAVLDGYFCVADLAQIRIAFHDVDVDSAIGFDSTVMASLFYRGSRYAKQFCQGSIRLLAELNLAPIDNLLGPVWTVPSDL